MRCGHFQVADSRFGSCIFRIVYPPRTGVFNSIRTGSTFGRWPKKIATQISTGKKSLQRHFWKKSISPILGQNLQPPPHRAHIQMHFKNSKSSHITAQSPHLGELWKLKVLTRYSTEPAHRGTLKTQSPHTPQHRVHTHGNFKNSKFSHTTARLTHTGTLKTQSPHTPHYGPHTQSWEL